MRAFLFLTCVMATALAYPEAGGYTYNNDLQRVLPQNVNHLETQIHQQLLPERSFGNFGELSTNHLAPPPPPLIADTPKINQPSASHYEDSYNMAYQHSIGSHAAGGYPHAQHTTIHKHIYVHAPPKDFENEDVITTRVRHQPAAKQKHYKIIFIKAPSPPNLRPPVIPPPQQNEEKTLIYVLHKKPELEQEIIIPTAAPTKPSKPEVYFIKYKTQKEEAPIYGPPPTKSEQYFGLEPRNVDAPTGEYSAANVDSFAPESTAALPTVQAATQEIQTQTQQHQQQQSINDFSSDVYGSPTMAAAVLPEEPQPTLLPPSNEYSVPEVPQGSMSPIIVEEPQVPSNKYGPPNQFFIKKKK